jgi:two-component system sensor histidine kinase YesM
LIRKSIKNITKSLYFSFFISFFSIISIFIMILGVYAYTQTSALLEQRVNEYNEIIKESVNEALTNYVHELEKITYLVYTPEAQEILNELNTIDSTSSWEYIDNKNDFFSSFYSWMGFRNFEHPSKRIFVINSDGSYYERSFGFIDPNYDLLDTSIYKKAVSKKGAIVFEVVDREDYLWNEEQQADTTTLLIARKINNQISNKDLGVMVIAIDWKHVTRVFDNIIADASGEFYIKDDNGEIVFHTDNNYNIKEYINNMSINNTTECAVIQDDEYLISNHFLPSTGWTFISASSLSDINQDIYHIKDLSILIILVSLISGALISILFSRSIIKPINKLRIFAGEIEKGILDSRIHINSYNEFNYLAKTFNLMAERLKKVIHKNYVLTLQEKEANLKLLHAQINPHFLYNTLNSINAYAQMYDIQEISDMTYALSDVLRYSIQNNKELVKVSEEIEHLKNYLLIQNIRYSNEIDIEVDIPEEILDYKITRFVLQPLVENALYHGLELKEEDKRLVIRAYQTDNVLKFEIIDNGIGIEVSELKKIQRYIKSSNVEPLGQESEKTSIGLINVHKRIQLTFGNEYGLEISSKLGQGTSIFITLPVLKNS